MTAPELPGYTFVAPLGVGGFAEVLLYEQQWPTQKVAVKVVRADIPLTDREKQMFAAEADAMARLADHPYIVAVMNAGTTAPDDGSRPYLVMRYCPPPDLGARVQAQPMSVPDAVATGVKLASAVETAHRSGIIHRDIKPSNVLVTPYHEPALTDFGIAGRLAEIEGDHEVRISYPWSPPELLDGRSNGSVASDVYSLGATIWNLLVGRSPFSIPNGDNSSRALSARILHSAPPRTQRPDVPPALDQLLAQCLAKTPEHRPASALELARGLQRIESQAGYARTPIAVAGDRPEQAVVPRGGGEEAGDATRLKPLSVVDGSAPASSADPPGAAGAAGGAESARHPLSTMLWWAGAAVVLLVVAGLLVWKAGGGSPSSDSTPTTSGPTTQQSVAPGVVPQPIVTGRRDGDEVHFTWRAADDPHAGDSYQWRIPSQPGDHLTTATTTTVRSAKRVCIQVRLARPGSAPSTYANACVS